MSVLLYTIFLFLFRIATIIASLFDVKARKWVRGRKKIFEQLESAIPTGEKVIWVHCASLGEFEQGRPVIEKIKKDYPSYKVLLTFFSPSGYEVQKNYQGADWVFYLPLDGPRNAKRFLEIVNPSLVIFVKYEFWFYYLKKTYYRNIPLLLISSNFRENMSFFKWYGGLQRKMLTRFHHIFVQDQSSYDLLRKLGLEKNCSVSGDTRFDRVLEIAMNFTPIPEVQAFKGETRLIVAGSTWPEDESLLAEVFIPRKQMFKLVIAPHEINEDHLQAIEKLFPGAVRYSRNKESPVNSSDTLIIDNIGMLSRLYQYGDLAFVGGGLTRNGVHNVLEAAVYDKTVLFGTNYEKYSEAVGLANAGGAIPVSKSTEAGKIIDGLFQNQTELKRRNKAAGNFVRSHGGATQTIMHYIQENRLLTR